MQQAIQAQLNRIVSLPLWGIGRAASLLWLQFGERHAVPAWRDGTKQVGTLALHVDCPWYWKCGNQIVASWRSEFELVERLVSQPTICRTAIARGSAGILAPSGTIECALPAQRLSDPDAAHA